jgi:hypothetical protein
MKDLMAASRVLRDTAEFPRSLSKWFKKSPTKGASICSNDSADGSTLSLAAAYVKSNWNA